MSADFDGTITFKGTSDEYQSVLQTLQMFENKYTQYRKQRDCWYLSGIKVVENNSPDQDHERIATFSFSGPYGVWNGPIDEEIDLFERIADATPYCWFKGNISGWDPGADQSIDAELKDGKLYLKSSYCPFDEACYDDEDDDYNEDSIDIDEDDDWERVYNPATKTYARFSADNVGDSVTVTIRVTDPHGVQHELVLASPQIEHPINLVCFPKELLAAADLDDLTQILLNSLKGDGAGLAKEKITKFAEGLKKIPPEWKPIKLELIKTHDHKAPFFFDWLRTSFVYPDMKKLAKRVNTCVEKNKPKKLAEFQEYLDSLVFYFPACEYPTWPNFCGFGHSIPYQTGGLSWNPETKAGLDWHGVADSLEEFAEYVCSKKTPREYAVERVIIDYVSGTTEQTATYMPRK